jgi:hypothetical protein
MLYLAPVALVAVYGGSWIALHASPGRGQVHTLFQGLALAETLIALLLRRRKPMGAFVSILAVYLIVDLDPTTLPPLLVALLTVATLGDRRGVALASAAVAVVVIAMPYVHSDPVNLLGYGIPRLLAVGLAIALGLNARARRVQPRSVAVRPPGERPVSSGSDDLCQAADAQQSQDVA